MGNRPCITNNTIQILLTIRSFVTFSIFLHALGMHASKAMDLQTIIGLGLPVVNIITENGEMPTCDIIAHPEGCVGQGITNMNKVRGRLCIHFNP